MKKFTIIFLMLAASVSFAQNAPIDFEPGGQGANWTWTVFENGPNPPLEIIANPDQSGINTSTTVAKFTALQIGQPWAGCESAHGASNLGPFVLNATNSIIKIMVWKPVISDVGIKLVAATGWALPEIKIANTLVNQWEELTFDFSAYPNPPIPEGQYDQIVVFPDFNLSGRTQTNIIYFDNVTFNPAGTMPEEPTVAAPTPPARDPDDVISIFSHAYANVPGTDFNPNWGQSTVVSFPQIQGNETLKYANFNYQGTNFATALDVTAMEFLHLDMWTANATSVNIFCISPGPVETAYALPITPGQWVSYDIPLSAFAGVNMADLIQFKFDGGNGSQTIYLDNIYFYAEGGVIGDTPRNPIDFEPGGYGADWTWTVFENGPNPPLEIITNPDQSGINTSATVAKFTALQSGNPWAGCESAHGDNDLGPFVLDATNSLIKIMVWKPVISDVGIKLVAATGWAQPEIKVANTLINQWEEITFDFSSYPNPPASEGMYDQIVIFPDFAARPQNNVIYFDNITFNEQGTTPGEPTVAAPTPPVRDPDDVVSIFSNAYANVPGTNFNPNWGQSTIVSFVEIQGNETMKYANFNYQGTQFAGSLNVTEMEFLHLDMWTADATSVNIFCISPGPVETPFALPITPGQWVSYDIPLSAFAPVNLADLIQFKFDGGNGSQTIYLDNIYFYVDGIMPTEPTVAAPTPPARDPDDVVSIFSHAYANVPGTDFNPGWGQTTIVSFPQIQGNETMKYANFNYQGTQFAGSLNVTEMEFLHLDMWTADATSVNIFCISPGPVETAYALPITPGTWVSYNIPLSAFTNVNMAELIQFKFDGGNGSQTIWLDNLYFYKPGETPRNPIDFEDGGYGANWTWTVFENNTNPPLEIIPNPDQTGMNTSATVAKFTALQSGNPWAGCESSHGDNDLGPFVLDATNAIIKIMVWKPVISDVGIKLAAPTGWAQPEIKVPNTMVNQWEELTFDFTGVPNPPASEGMYDQIIVFPDFDLAGRTQDNVIYFDNITFNSFLPGDSNCDGLVNVIDIVITANYILGANPDPFCFENADVNGDGNVDVNDVTATVNIILAEK